MTDRQDAPASFTIYAESEEKEAAQNAKAPRVDLVYMIASGAVMVAIAIALVLMVGGLMHADNVNSGQAAQIRSLNQANARMSLQLSQMTATLSGQDPATDSNLVTCGDLKKMGLTVTTGAGIEAGGSIGLSQNPVRLPAHCVKR